MMIEKQENKYQFFQHRECEYFPCHADVNENEFNCLFCYCPLYALGRDCGGAFSYENESHIKDCTQCLLPHRKAAYNTIVKKCIALIERFGK